MLLSGVPLQRRTTKLFGPFIRVARSNQQRRAARTLEFHERNSEVYRALLVVAAPIGILGAPATRGADAMVTHAEFDAVIGEAMISDTGLLVLRFASDKEARSVSLPLLSARRLRDQISQVLADAIPRDEPP